MRFRRICLSFLSLAVVAGITGLIVSARSGASAARVSQPVQASEIFPSLYFRITERGMEPKRLTVKPGRYFVAIDNDSGFNEVDVKFDTQGGARLVSAQLIPGRRKWRGLVVLTPGRINLTDPGNSNRRVTLDVSDK